MNAIKDNMVGKRFGRWTVVSFSHRDKHGCHYYHCKCECGTERNVYKNSLKKGISQSCGCFKHITREKNINDMVGKIFGRWTVISFSHRTKQNREYYNCKCLCGTRKILRGDALPKSKSCGCSQIKHGESYKNGTPEYRTWHGMKGRCYNPKDKSYKDYGNRGIQICNRWLTSYKNFLEDMGRKPSSKHSIERIDNDGNYEPGNCKWATIQEQNINKRAQNLSIEKLYPELDFNTIIEQMKKRRTTAINKAIGEKIECVCCSKEIVKENYNQKFCSSRCLITFYSTIKSKKFIKEGGNL